MQIGDTLVITEHDSDCLGCATGSSIIRRQIVGFVRGICAGIEKYQTGDKTAGLSASELLQD